MLKKIKSGLTYRISVKNILKLLIIFVFIMAMFFWPLWIKPKLSFTLAIYIDNHYPKQYGWQNQLRNRVSEATAILKNEFNIEINIAGAINHLTIGQKDMPGRNGIKPERNAERLADLNQGVRPGQIIHRHQVFDGRVIQPGNIA